MAGIGASTIGNQPGAAATPSLPPPATDVTVGGQTFRTDASGKAPHFEQFQGRGGAYDKAWNDVSARIGSQDNQRVSGQLEWDYQMGQAPAAQAADWLAGRDVSYITTEASSTAFTDTAKVANDLAALQLKDPGRAQSIETALGSRLSTADYGRLHEDLRTAQGWADTADAKLTATAPQPGQVDAKAVPHQADALLKDATGTSPLSSWASGRTVDHLSVPHLAYGVQKLAESNPAQATAVRAALTARIGAQDAGDLNRILAGESHFGEGVGVALSHPGEAIEGAGRSLAGFATNVGDIFVRGSMYQTAGEQQQAAGMSSLLGSKEQAAGLSSSADAIHEAAGQRQLPVIEPKNIAQKGGADIETGIEVSTGVAGAAKGLGRLAVRESLEGVEVAGATGAKALARGTAEVVELDPHKISFTQSWVSSPKRVGGQTVEDLAASMSKDGWVGKPVDVVEMKSGGLASIDNTRILAARKAGIEVQAVVHKAGDPITDLARQSSLRVGDKVPQTWGEAAEIRIGRSLQNDVGKNGGIGNWSQRFPEGSLDNPNVVTPRK